MKSFQEKIALGLCFERVVSSVMRQEGRRDARVGLEDT